MRVFISHTSKDVEFAKRLASDVRASNIDVFTYFDAIMPGDSIGEKIGSAILNSDAIILLLSNQSAKSPWVSSEIALAKASQSKSKTPRIFPIIIGQFNFSDTPFFIRDLFHLDMSDDEKYQANLPKLVDALSVLEIIESENYQDLKKGVQAREQMNWAQETALVLEKEFYAHKSAAKNRYIAWLTAVGSVSSMAIALTVVMLNYIAKIGWPTLLSASFTFFAGILVSFFFYRKSVKYETERMSDKLKELDSLLQEITKEREESK